MATGKQLLAAIIGEILYLRLERNGLMTND